MTQSTQTQNEALVRLMLAARYQDKRLSLIEEEEFQKHLDKLPWESITELDLFVMQESTYVRKALESEDAKQSFLINQCSHFQTPAAKALCMKTIELILESDGVEQRESAFLQQIEAAIEK